jgi:hypothetical protein
MANMRFYCSRVKVPGWARLALALVLVGGAFTLAVGSPLPPDAAAGKAGPQMRRGAASTSTNPRVLGSGKRDPFYLPPPPPAGGVVLPTGPLPPGKRGLIIGQLKLEGIVREDQGGKMIAVVTNYTNRAYFLEVNDQLYDGTVEKITSRAVYFKQNHLDANGRLTTVEVVKSLGPAAGEGR